MAEMTLVIDPAGTSFALHDRANGRWVTGLQVPTPETKSQWASSIDTEGDRRAVLGFTNRTISATVLLQKGTAALLESLENDLGKKIHKLQRDGGTLRLGYASGTTIDFTVFEASMQRVFDPAHVVMNMAAYEVSFVCAPHGESSSETDLGDNTEATLPALIFSESSLVGDVAGKGRLVVDNDSTVDWDTVIWGVEDDADYAHTTSTGSGALFYEAESRTVLGGAAATAVASASGGTVVRQGTLTTVPRAMLSTQASGGGSHLSHVGEFNVWARLQMPTTNTGTVTVGFEWTHGDFARRTMNPTVTYDANHAREGAWILQDLGQVTIPVAKTGTQRWEGRIVAQSSVLGDDLDVDYLMFVPFKRASGIAKAVRQYDTPTTFTARDEFDQTAGNLNGKVAPTGGTWVTGGTTGDFSVTGSGAVTRSTAVTNTDGVGRYGVLDVNMTTTAVQCDVTIASSGSTWEGVGVVARFVDASNYMRMRYRNNTDEVVVEKIIAGTTTVLGTADLSVVEDVVYRYRLVVDTAGRWYAWVNRATEASPAILVRGQDDALATGGTLAAGDVGIWDEGHNSTTAVRTFDNFAAWAPTIDAAIYASQSMQIRHDGVIREDSSGAVWANVADYKGDYLLIPASGAEGRSVRFIVKPCRNDPDTMTDPAIDDISANGFVKPRFLVVPD